MPKTCISWLYAAETCAAKTCRGSYKAIQYELLQYIKLKTTKLKYWQFINHTGKVLYVLSQLSPNDFLSNTRWRAAERLPIHI